MLMLSELLVFSLPLYFPHVSFWAPVGGRFVLVGGGVSAGRVVLSGGGGVSAGGRFALRAFRSGRGGAFPPGGVSLRGRFVLSGGGVSAGGRFALGAFRSVRGCLSAGGRFALEPFRSVLCEGARLKSNCPSD